MKKDKGTEKDKCKKKIIKWKRTRGLKRIGGSASYIKPRENTTTSGGGRIQITDNY